MHVVVVTIIISTLDLWIPSKCAQKKILLKILFIAKK